MIRTAIALAIVCVTASAALARDLCIQIDSGFYAGSALVLKKARVTRRSVAPVQGYLAKYSSVVGDFNSFYPLYGQSITSSNGAVAFGITFHSAYVGTGSGNASSPPQSISMVCLPQPGGTLRPPDSCSSTYISGTSVSAHVIDCFPEAAIP